MQLCVNLCPIKSIILEKKYEVVVKKRKGYAKLSKIL